MEVGFLHYLKSHGLPANTFFVTGATTSKRNWLDTGTNQ